MTGILRPIRVDGNIAIIPLTRGYEAKVDLDDLPKIGVFNWYADVRPNRRAVYAVRNCSRGEKTLVTSLHRVLMGNPDGLVVDHIDGDGLNNCKSNLRIATFAQNVQNQSKRIDNTSGFKGVTWHKQKNKWRAMISVNGRMRHIGVYLTPEEAHAAYCRASKQFHGEFGRVS